MAKPRKVVVDYVVYVAVRGVVALLQTLPLSAGWVVADFLAAIAHAVDKRHRRIALENVRLAFGDRLTEAQRQRLVYGVYVHFLRMIVEMAHIPRKLSVTNWKSRTTPVNPGPTARALLDNSRPTLMVTGHFGNWEVGGFLIAALGVRSYAIARDLDNQFLHRFLLRFREYTGQTILSKNGDFDRICQVLAEKQVLISVGDQSAGPRGPFVDFFGRPASTHKAIALLALEFDAKILVGCAYRDRPGFHYTIAGVGEVDPRDYADRPDAALAMTQDFTSLLEDAIRRSPEQYLWLHNRWKHNPPTRKTKAA